MTNIHQQNTESAVERFLKLATIVPLFGVILYSLGWNYWKAYFFEFGIAESLISLQIETVIVTTWSLLVGAILLTSISIINFIEYKHQDRFEIFGSIYVIYISIIIGLLRQDNGWKIFIALVIGTIIFIGVKVLEHYKKITLNTMPKNNYLILCIVTIYVFGIFHYIQRGKENAKDFVRDYKEDVQLITNDGNVILGCLIANMQSKYYILVEDANCIKSVQIYNDENIKQVNIITYNYVR